MSPKTSPNYWAPNLQTDTWRWCLKSPKRDISQALSFQKKKTQILLPNSSSRCKRRLVKVAGERESPLSLGGFIGFQRHRCCYGDPSDPLMIGDHSRGVHWALWYSIWIATSYTSNEGIWDRVFLAHLVSASEYITRLGSCWRRRWAIRILVIVFRHQNDESNNWNCDDSHSTNDSDNILTEIVKIMNTVIPSPIYIPPPS